MIIGIGVDLEEVSRIGESVEKFKERFLERIFTAQEVAFCAGKANANQRFAARFAAKEAAFKALQASWERGVHWTDFELIAQPGGAPRMELHGVAAEIAREKGVTRVHVSFSHTTTHVTAMVVMEG
jgi:holo-[acyl-carrier protein] synthase